MLFLDLIWIKAHSTLEQSSMMLIVNSGHSSYIKKFESVYCK